MEAEAVVAQLDGPVVIGQGRLVLRYPRVGDGAVDVDLRVFGIVPQRRVIVLDCLGVPVEVGPGPAARDVRLSQAGVEENRLVQLDYGPFKVAGVAVLDGRFVVDLGLPTLRLADFLIA